jgi:hypothetical protein
VNVGQLFERLVGTDAKVAFEAADELEKLSRQQIDAFLAYRAPLYKVVQSTSQPGVQWHMAEIVPRLDWSANEARVLCATFEQWILHSPSRIVKADALSAISYLAHEHADLMPVAKQYLARALKIGSPAEQARARKLISRQAEPEV